MDDEKSLNRKRTQEVLESPKNTLKKHNEEDLKHIELPFEKKYEKFLHDNKSFFELIKKPTSLDKTSLGSFNNCYGVKGIKPWRDLRAELIQSKWIRNRTCLDIGSNEGIFTIILCVKYMPKMIVGCDIDYSLIQIGRAHV